MSVKNLITSHRKVIIIVLASLAVGFYGGMEYKAYQIRRGLQEVGNALSEAFGNNDSSKESGISKVAQEAVKSEPSVSCPDIVGTADYSFFWGDSLSGNRKLWLNAVFLKDIKFDENYELANLPSTSTYSSDTFPCEKGSKAGESVSKLYCGTTYSYEPKLRKNEVDSAGNIIKSDYLYLTRFVFDISGKDINNANDLKGLRLESIGCSEQSI